MLFGILMAVSIAAKAMSANSGREAMVKANRAAALEQQVGLLQAYAQRRNMLREGQVNEANALVQGVASGADLGSSGIQGVLASIRSQEAGNVALSDAMVGKQTAAGQLNRDAADAQSKAATFAAISSIAGTAAALAGAPVGRTAIASTAGQQASQQQWTSTFTNSSTPNYSLYSYNFKSK